MRRHVTPADPGATIPDPERGTALPPEGRTVTWSAHWALMQARGEITDENPQNEVAAEPPASATPPTIGAKPKASKTSAA